jgi:RNA polymerase sigma-70 factor (ECF subfamily)
MRTPRAPYYRGAVDANAVSRAMDRYAMGDAAAFGEVYDGLSPRLLGFLRRRARNDALAEELLQQTFLQIHASREHYRTGLDVVPWAFAIARRLLIDVMRKSGREVLGGAESVSEPASPDPHPDEEFAMREAAGALKSKIASLPANQREAFELVKLEGLSLAQAAQALGATVMAVKLRLHRAYETLRLDVREPQPEESVRQ